MPKRRRILLRVLAAPFPTRAKRLAETWYWLDRQKVEGGLRNEWYADAYTKSFELAESDYVGKRILDIGCGPRGSLEWADMASERVGLDPLAGAYRRLGTETHKMTYVESGAEKIPFDDGHFDIVTSFNSLDHVDDLAAAIAEVERVTRTGGTILIATDVNHPPTIEEPQTFSWDVTNLFARSRVTWLRRYEKHPDGLYTSLREATPYNDRDPSPRYGVLVARLIRR